MLTPYFELTQTDSVVIITIHAPYANIKDTEIYVEGDDFRFYSTPYYLRLHLPGKVKEIDAPSARYISDKGHFEVTLEKSQHGEHFPDLDLIGGLLAPKKQKEVFKPDIQVISSTENSSIKSDEEEENSTRNNEDEDVDVESDSVTDSDNEWLIEQEPIARDLISCTVNSPRYGFGNQTQGVFKKLGEEFYEVVNLRSADEMDEGVRSELRKSEEDKLFSDDHYLCDFMEPENLLQYVGYNPIWDSAYYKAALTKEDLETLKNFGNKEYLLSKGDQKSALLSLADIIFACTYDFRTTLGEATVESAWTINKLSATLSWLQIFGTPEEVVECCIRRSLVYPLYRNWELSMKVLKDTINILNAGKRQIIWFLLRTRKLFNESEPRYILNELYIKDYCIWLQTVPDSKLHKLADSIAKVSLTKCDVGFDLDILEVAAKSVVDDVKEAQLTQQLGSISLKTREQAELSEDEDDEDNSSSLLDSDDVSESEE